VPGCAGRRARVPRHLGDRLAAVGCLRSGESKLTGGDADGLLATAEEFLDQLADLVASLLDVSRLQGGAVPARRRPWARRPPGRPGLDVRAFRLAHRHARPHRPWAQAHAGPRHAGTGDDARWRSDYDHFVACSRHTVTKTRTSIPSAHSARVAKVRQIASRVRPGRARCHRSRTPGRASAGPLSLRQSAARGLRSAGQRAEQGGRVVASPVHHAVDEQGGGAQHLSRGDPAVDVPADTL
jgi:hypothetical protein